MLVLMALITTAMTAPLLWAIWLRHEGKSQAPDGDPAALELPDENYLSHSVHGHGTYGEDTAAGHSPTQNGGARDPQAGGANSPAAMLGVSSV